MNHSTTFRNRARRAGRVGTIGVGLFAAALVLAGCSGSEGGSDSAAPSSAAQAAASSIASAAGVAPVGTEDASPAGGAVSAEEFCDQLKKTQPKLDKVGTPVGAMAQLVGDLASFYSAKGAMAAMDGTKMDAMVAQACPEAGAAALKSAGLTSFSAL